MVVVLGGSAAVPATEWQAKGPGTADQLNSVEPSAIVSSMDGRSLATLHVSRRLDKGSPIHPFTAPAVSPLTICFWNTMTRKNSGAVIETAAATA